MGYCGRLPAGPSFPRYLALSAATAIWRIMRANVPMCSSFQGSACQGGRTLPRPVKLFAGPHIAAGWCHNRSYETAFIVVRSARRTRAWDWRHEAGQRNSASPSQRVTPAISSASYPIRCLVRQLRTLLRRGGFVEESRPCTRGRRQAGDRRNCQAGWQIMMMRRCGPNSRAHLLAGSPLFLLGVCAARPNALILAVSPAGTMADALTAISAMHLRRGELWLQFRVAKTSPTPMAEGRTTLRQHRQGSRTVSRL